MLAHRIREHTHHSLHLRPSNSGKHSRAAHREDRKVHNPGPRCISFRLPLSSHRLKTSVCTAVPVRATRLHHSTLRKLPRKTPRNQVHHSPACNSTHGRPLVSCMIPSILSPPDLCNFGTPHHRWTLEKKQSASVFSTVLVFFFYAQFSNTQTKTEQALFIVFTW